MTESQELVREKARQFWPSLFPDTEMPMFSNSWLQNFKNRRNIKASSHHDNIGNLFTNTEEKMIGICQVINKYSSKDIFNCDGSGLYWRMIPDQITSDSVPGREKASSRIILDFCTDPDASERLPVWIIGIEKKPRVFKTTGINIENLGCHCRHNKKAEMTGKIFKEWLCWFDKKMVGRNVLLLMDSYLHMNQRLKRSRHGFKILWLYGYQQNQHLITSHLTEALFKHGKPTGNVSGFSI
jgi:hypothetical protein